MAAGITVKRKYTAGSGGNLTKAGTSPTWQESNCACILILQPARNGDMVSSRLAHYDQSVLKLLPIWSHYANDNWCMSGYHSVSVIADAIAKGNTHFDAAKALDACINTARHRNYEGIGSYM